MKVVPITQVDQEGNKLSLTIGREYEVLGLEANMYRILTDETAYLLKSSANRERLLKAIDNVAHERNLVTVPLDET